MAPKERNEYLEWAHKTAAEKKTHVSFPQLKYPSLRDDGLRDPVQWLTGKAMDDGAEGLWRVYDKIYDLNGFLNNHPGGAEWLELTKGTDITEAFECHHFTQIAYDFLEKYYVRDAKTPRNSPFTFKEDGFFKTLKRDVIDVLKTVPKDVHKRSDRIIDGLFTTFLASSALSVYVKDYWWSMAFYLIASVTMAFCISSSHNYIHRRTNWRMYIFNLGLWSYRDFRVSHALSHHLYPNTLMDLEMSAFEPMLYWIPRKKAGYVRFTLLIEILFFPFLLIVNFVKRNILIFLRKGFFTEHYRWHDIIGLLVPVWMYLATGVTFKEAFIGWLWINLTASSVFFHIGANAAHHHPVLFKDGDQVKESTIDWGMHELAAVLDRKDINMSLFTVLTFFGDHSLHHLFPTLDHAVLPYLYPCFMKNVEKYKAKFRVFDQFNLIIGQFKMCTKQDPNLLTDED